MKKEKQSPFANLHHIGLVVKDIDRAAKMFSTLGLGPFAPAPMKDLTDRELRGKKVPSHVDVWFAPLGEISIELVKPLTGESLQKETLKLKGEGIEHLGFFVENIWEEVEKLEKKGWTVIARARAQQVGGWCFLQPEAESGIYIELVEPWE